MMVSIEISLALFVALLGGLEFGRWLRYRMRADDQDLSGASAADGVVFAVLGLLIAFTFTASASRFDQYRKLIIEHANALGTAWLRTSLLPPAEQAPIRERMKQWCKLSLEIPQLSAENDQAKLAAALDTANRLQNEAWQLAVDASQRHPQPQFALLVLPPMNDWIDLTTTRLEMRNRDLPPLVMPTLMAMSIVAAVLAGFGMAKRPTRNLLHMFAFAGVVAFSIYVILDLNEPRSGVIRIDAADNSMRQLYLSMQEAPNPTTTKTENPG